MRSQPTLHAFQRHALTRHLGLVLKLIFTGAIWGDRRQTAHAAPTRCGDSGHVSAFQRMTRASMRLSTRKSNMTTAMMRHTTPISSDALYELCAKLNR